MSSNHKRARRPVRVQGQDFPSLQAAADHYGKPAKLFRKRMLVSGLTPEQALELEPFPDWFSPGKGQFARARGQARLIAEQASGLRRCGTCCQYKALTEFHKRKGELLSSRCKECTAGALIRSRYGLEPEEFNAIASKQKGLCAICSIDLKLSLGSVCRDKTVAVDHCHQSGKVRGILCNLCNTGLGSFIDSETRLCAAIQYLRRANAGSQLLD